MWHEKSVVPIVNPQLSASHNSPVHGTRLYLHDATYWEANMFASPFRIMVSPTVLPTDYQGKHLCRY